MIALRALLLLASCGFLSAATDFRDNWHQWRGPEATGVSPRAKPPESWSETNNVRWKKKLPGLGHAAPIVWDDRVFVLSAVAFGPKREPVYTGVEGAHDNYPVIQKHRFVIQAFARKNGAVLWEKTLWEGYPHEGGHYTGSLISNSPITDGKQLYVSLGSRGLYALDLNGKVNWEKDLGKMETRHAHGEGSSPALHGETLVLNWDHQKQSYLMAFNTRIGKQLWKVKRDEMTSWSTPLIVEHEGKTQIIVSATGAVRGYDLKTGRVIWECRGLSRNVVATPVSAKGMVFAANSYDWQAMLAIRLRGSQGDITDSTNVVWKLNRLTPYVPSPLLVDDTLFFLRHNQNIISIVDTVTGKNVEGPYRIPGIREVFASPVAADGKIYIADRSGNTIVYGFENRKLSFRSVNRLDEKFSASPALAGKELYLRGERHLYCLAEE
ncbi:MAG: PQQ-binding-like beta-propeller repeat protein [Limisphaerales bacterium]